MRVSLLGVTSAVCGKFGPVTMSHRFQAWRVLVPGPLFGTVARAPAGADQAAAAVATEELARGAPEPSAAERGTTQEASSLAGFELLVSAGFGRHTTSVYGAEIEPYGAMFGFEPGYTFAKGFRLALYLDYGLGQGL